MFALRMLIALAVFVIGLGLSMPAQSQDAASAPAESEKVETVYQKTTIIDFSDVTITGELTKPEGSYLMNKKRANFNLLIRVRDNFLPEMIKSVDNL